MKDPKLTAEILKVKAQLLKEIEESNESPEDKRALKAIFGSMSPEELFRAAFPGQHDLDDLEEGQKDFDFLPPFTLDAPFSPLQFGDSGTKQIGSSVIHFVWNLRDLTHLNIFFIRCGEKTFYACCHYGPLFNYIYGKDVRNTAGGERFSRQMAKTYPYICSLLRNCVMHGKRSQPYLNTIGFAGKPRQWFLCVRISDMNEFVDLSLYGPESQCIQNVINEMSRAVVRIVQEIYAGADPNFIHEYEKSCGQDNKCQGHV